MMYPMPPSIDANVPPNYLVTSFMTSHNRGIAIASIFNSSRMQNNIFKILPIVYNLNVAAKIKIGWES